jgi:hypothetical protein
VLRFLSAVSWTDHYELGAFDRRALFRVMTHDDFILGYQSGRLGCGVSALLLFRLFLAGRIREKRVMIRLICWSIALLLLIGLSTIGFLYLPALWAILGTIVMLAVFALGSTHQIGGFVVSAALADKRFYEFARAEHALWVSDYVEGNLPKLKKVVPMRPPRRAQR